MFHFVLASVHQPEMSKKCLLSLRICDIKLMNVHSSTENQLEDREEEEFRAPWGCF